MATHRAVHNERGFEVGIEIPDDTAQQLNDEDSEVRRRTRDFICVTVRKACIEKYGPERTEDLSWVDWDEVHITHLSKPVAVECCKDKNCTPCNTFQHERCTNGCNV